MFRHSSRIPNSILVGLGILIVGPSCLLDADLECGPNQILDDHNVCVCAPNAVVSTDEPLRCLSCPAGEFPVAGRCDCPSGFGRNSLGACVAIPPGLGASCVNAMSCTKSPYLHCAAVASGGYCTSTGCATDSDCILDYRCDVSASSPFCRRAPRGQGTPCQSSAECASTDAKLCLPTQNYCVVQGCSIGGNDCPGKNLCCDLSPYGLSTVCLEKCP